MIGRFTAQGTAAAALAWDWGAVPLRDRQSAVHDVDQSRSKFRTLPTLPSREGLYGALLAVTLNDHKEILLPTLQGAQQHDIDAFMSRKTVLSSNEVGFDRGLRVGSEPCRAPARHRSFNLNVPAEDDNTSVRLSCCRPGC